MAAPLYLDTARLGRMSPAAQQADRAFAALAGEEGGSLYFERLLRDGAEACPTAGSRFPGHAARPGVSGLKRTLRVLAGSEPELPVLLSSRSAQLMRLAARLLFRCCRNVLVTDLGWRPYHAILEAEGDRVGRRVTTCPLRDTVFSARASAADVVTAVVDRYSREGCDGLFLPAVSHDGVRLPVCELVRGVGAAREVRFVVVDGAQGFCQVATEVGSDCYDLYLTGCHKWLGGYLPLGVSFYGRRRSRAVVETTRDRMIASGELDDPLLRFTGQLEEGRLDGVSETVNLAPLFTCHGAATDQLATGPVAGSLLDGRVENVRLVGDLSCDTAWEPLPVSESVQSGILLLRSKRDDVRAAPADATRSAFAERGVTLTAYDRAVVRLALPDRPLAERESDLLHEAFTLVA
ncbi:MAG: hypothetical protein K2X82_04890 [Gemmataceae bacterium]|nr:hypothetical protein [Gemmataceae bacterium]